MMMVVVIYTSRAFQGGSFIPRGGIYCLSFETKPITWAFDHLQAAYNHPRHERIESFEQEDEGREGPYI